MGQQPAVDQTRHGHAAHAVHGNAAFGHIAFTRGGLRRGAGGVDRADLAAVRIVNEEKAVAAHAGRLRLDHAQRGCGGDGGVDGVAARHHGANACLRGQRMPGRDHAVARHEGRAKGFGAVAVR